LNKKFKGAYTKINLVAVQLLIFAKLTTAFIQQNQVDIYPFLK